LRAASGVRCEDKSGHESAKLRIDLVLVDGRGLAAAELRDLHEQLGSGVIDSSARSASDVVEEIEERRPPWPCHKFSISPRKVAITEEMEKFGKLVGSRSVAKKREERSDFSRGLLIGVLASSRLPCLLLCCFAVVARASACHVFP